MKQILLTLLICISAICSIAQTKNNLSKTVEDGLNPTYRIYKMDSANFVKLNTQTGEMKHLRWPIGRDAYEKSLTDVVFIRDSEEKVNGRFVIYLIDNSCSFFLLDSFDGRVWLVRWPYPYDNWEVEMVEHLVPQ